MPGWVFSGKCRNVRSKWSAATTTTTTTTGPWWSTVGGVPRVSLWRTIFGEEKQAEENLESRSNEVNKAAVRRSASAAVEKRVKVHPSRQTVVEISAARCVGEPFSPPRGQTSSHATLLTISRLPYQSAWSLINDRGSSCLDFLGVIVTRLCVLLSTIDDTGRDVCVEL